MAELLIPRDKSVIVAADVKPDQLSPLVEATHNVEGISGYKVGLALGLSIGLPETVRRIRQHSETSVIIYDHQKAGNDIPDMGKEFADVCRQAGVDAVILFPFAGHVTETTWIKAAQDADLRVLVGGHMTHSGFLASEDGFIADDAPERIYRLAAETGVRDFVVPGNKAESVRKYRQVLEEVLGPDNFALYAPGFIAQGGKVSDFALEAGNRWHAIVGRGIYAAENMHSAAEETTSQIR